MKLLIKSSNMFLCYYLLTILFHLYYTALCDSENEVKFVKPDVNLDASKLEHAFPDNLELMHTINQETITDVDEKPAFQNSELIDVDENEVVFSVLENSKTKAEEDYPHDRIMITDADLPNYVETENKTTTVKNKTVTVECALKELEENEEVAVIVANSTLLLKVLTPSVTTNTTNSTIGECAIVLFYSSYCVFSARMAPHYNALARVFPGISFYALDASQHYSAYMRYGVVAVPIVLLFHNGKAVARFNESIINLDSLAAFVTKFTNLQHNDTLNVTSADMNGPVPATLTKRVDFVLILAWIFTIFCLCLWFLKSPIWHRIVESVRNTWREAEAQHEHDD